MYKKNGFTLIELLAVVVVLAIVLTISSVVIVGNLNENKNNISKIQEENIISAAKAYINDNLDEFTSDSSTICTINGNNRTCEFDSDLLVSEGYIEQPKDLKTKQNINYNIDVSFKLNNGVIQDLEIRISGSASSVASSTLIPIDDSKIKTLAKEFPFSVTNTKDSHQKLTISMTNISIPDELKNVDFRWGLYNQDTGNGLSFGTFADIGSATSMVIYKDTIIDAANPDITKNYVLRVWIHDNGADQTDMLNKDFSTKVSVSREDVEYTPEECFTFNSEMGAIYGTWDGFGYDPVFGYDINNPKCPSDVVVPRTINGVAVEVIDEWAFGGFDTYTFGLGITSLILPDTVKKIDNSIAGSTFTHLTVPEGVTAFAWASLYDIPIRTIYLPETITEINSICAPGGCEFDNIIIPGSVTTINYEAMISSENIILMNGIKNISTTSIYDCGELLEIPSSVKSIQSDAIYGSNIKKIVIRGKDSLNDFTDASGITIAGGLSEGVAIEFRP